MVTALAFVAVAPTWPLTNYIDIGGSIVVSVYLIVNGIITIRGSNSIVQSKIS